MHDEIEDPAAAGATDPGTTPPAETGSVGSGDGADAVETRPDVLAEDEAAGPSGAAAEAAREASVALPDRPLHTERPDREPTGDDEVDRALVALDESDGRPLQEQIEEITAVHRTLQHRLSDLRD
ncbi:hypothetical protein [Luteipulveratus flavus]|uniref:Uncharacterized protein n=1 Tax=Luteipulveratus flavus TaxID=3031728 RepID=A0ABT6C5I7_9MICO|nr:hypothetical protein [Luteipulveratus sp. YIM 133296]MDF8264199.1 hypothetical protein [Luteipulveratus sp. YIM 133296]